MGLLLSFGEYGAKSHRGNNFLLSAAWMLHASTL